MLKIILSTFLFFHLASTKASFGRSPSVLYTMDDLIALDDLKSSGEILRHIFDIRPSKRSDQWKSLLSRNVRLFIDNIISNKKYTQSDYRLIEKITASKYLNSDEIFLIRRSEYLENFFENCFQTLKKEKFDCKKEIKLSIRKSPNIELFPEAHSSLGLVLKKYEPQTKLLPFIKTAIIRPIGLKVCTNPFVISELMLQIEKIIDLSKNKKESIARTNDLLGQECLGVIVEEIKTNFDAIASTSLQEKYYKWLKQNDQLEETENIKFLSLLFLSGVKPGQTLNLAWNTLRELSENFDKRILILNELKKFDPVPDSFLQKDNLSKQVFLRHLDKNFPEFIDYYASTCKSYYQGTQHFPNGNPTINCKEFVNIYKKLKGTSNLKVSSLEKSIKI